MNRSNRHAAALALIASPWMAATAALGGDLSAAYATKKIPHGIAAATNLAGSWLRCGVATSWDEFPQANWARQAKLCDWIKTTALARYVDDFLLGANQPDRINA